MDAVSFTTSEFIRLEQQVKQLIEMNKELRAELFKWKPRCTVESNDSTGVITFISQYANDGQRVACTTKFLSQAPPEVLALTMQDIAHKTCLIREKAVSELIRYDMQRAADYSKTLHKVK